MPSDSKRIGANEQAVVVWLLDRSQVRTFKWRSSDSHGHFDLSRGPQRYAQPILAGDDLPDMVVILAHGARPLWMNEAFFLVRRRENMCIDISGIPPQKLMEHFPRIEEIADKVRFGTDWPAPGVPDIKENIEKFRALPISAALQRKILYDNAARVFPV